MPQYSIGTLPNLTIVLNNTLDELYTGIGHATGTLASATTKINQLLMLANATITPADGTLLNAVIAYNSFVTDRIGLRSIDFLGLQKMTDTGSMTAVKKFSFDFTLKFTPNNGEAQRSYGPFTLSYPDSVLQMPVAVQQAWAVKIVDAYVRVLLGLNKWEDFT